MPQRRSAIKALRQSHKKQMHNLDIKSDLRRTIKDFLATVQAKDKKEAENKLKLVYKKFDKATKRHVLNKNTASRRKSRFAKLLTSIA